MLTFHKAVYTHYTTINSQINEEFEGFYVGRFLILWYLIGMVFVSYLVIKEGLSNNFEILVISVLLSFVISPLVPVETLTGGRLRIKKVSKRELAAFFNVSIPILIMGLLFYPLLTPIHCQSYDFIHFNLSGNLSHSVVGESSILSVQNVSSNTRGWITIKIPDNIPRKTKCFVNMSVLLNSSCKLNLCNHNRGSVLYYAIFAFILEILWLLLFSWGRLLTDGRELDVLKDNDKIKSSIFGLLMTLIISGVLVVIWISNLPGSLKSNLPNVLVASFGLIALAYVVGSAKERAFRLLWKAEVRDFANNLPHLIVKTKTGNIYYGQLYDPLDSKALVLRKSRLMHGGQIVEDKNELIPWSLWENEGDYWIIPWNDIESIKIVEEGLYAPPELSGGNFSSQGTDKSSEEHEGNKPESTTGKTENESTSKT